MKKVSKLFCVIAIILMLLLANCSYATEVTNSLVDNTTLQDMVLDGTRDELFTSDENNGIMLINEEDGVMPINEDMQYNYTNTVESDVYLINQNVSLNENVNGNIYVIGQSVDISSEWIYGNVFVIADNVTIKGNISGSVYALAQTINIETTSVGTVYAMAETINLENGANIANDLKAAAENININGNVYREIYIGAENINVSDTAEHIAKGSVYYSNNLTDAKNLLSNINVVKTEDSQKIENTVKTAIVGATIKTQIINIVSAVLVIAVIYFLVRNRVSETEEISANAVIKNVVSGLCWLVFTPIVCVILLCTIIGVPLAIIGFVLYILAIYISVPVASLKIGSIVLKELKQENKIMIIVYAICVYILVELISLIPTIGGIIKFIVILYGLGTFMKTIFSAKDKKVEKKEEVVIETKAE